MTRASGGKIIGKYRLIAELGHGGMADVYLAVMQGVGGFHKLQVIKRLRTQFTDEADFLAMFLDEARLAARLNHPNVVQTLEVGQDGDNHFIAMEHLDGQALHTLLSRAARRQPLSLAMHLQILGDVLAGLHHAHELKDFDGTPLYVVHRDVSPHNVFVTYEGQVKVVDFGIAKAATTLNETRTGILKGKVTYMAPEQARCTIVDRRADIFSVGVMLWEALTGRRLWEGLQEMQILHRLTTGEIPPIPSLPFAVPEALARICTKALAHLREDRYETAALMQADIERYLATAGGRVLPVGMGSFVADLFQDRRAELRVAIEEQLRELSLAHRPSSGSFPIPHFVPSLSGTLLVPGARPSNTVTTSPPPPFVDVPPARDRFLTTSPVTRPTLPTLPLPRSPQPDFRLRRSLQVRRTQILSVTAGAVVFLLTSWWAGNRYLRSTESRLGSVGASPSAAVSGFNGSASGTSGEDAIVVPTENVVAVRLSASPSDARLFFDDTLLPANPYVAKFPRSGTTHRFRAEAPGFVSKTEMVTLVEEHLEHELTLEKERSPGRGSVPRASERPPRPSLRRPSPSQLHDDPWSHLGFSAMTVPVGPIVVCGLGQVGYRVVRLLRRVGVPVTVIDLQPRVEWVDALQCESVRIVVGDARNGRLMLEAGLANASALLAITDRDDVNTEVLLDAYRVNPSVPLVLRMFDPHLASHLESALLLQCAAGVSRLVAPSFAAAALGANVAAAFSLRGVSYVVAYGDSTATPSPGVSSLLPPGDEPGLVLTEHHDGGATWMNPSLRPARQSTDPAEPRAPGGSFLTWSWRQTSLPLRTVVLSLFVLLLGSAWLFRVAMHLSVVDAVYFLITTLTTTGYGDITPSAAGPAVKLYACLVMVLGSAMTAILYSLLTEYVVAERFRNLFGSRPVPKGGHVIVVGVGNVGYRVIDELRAAGVAVVAVVKDEGEEFVPAIRQHHAVVTGDARLAETLIAAGVETASAIVAVTSEDTVNLSVALASQRSQPAIRTVVRIFDEEFAQKVTHALRIDVALSAPAIAAPTFAAAALLRDVKASLLVKDALLVLCERDATADQDVIAVDGLPTGSTVRTVLRERVGEGRFRPYDEREPLGTGDRVLVAVRMPLRALTSLE